jgi:hypothetical protein
MPSSANDAVWKTCDPNLSPGVNLVAKEWQLPYFPIVVDDGTADSARVRNGCH